MGGDVQGEMGRTSSKKRSIKMDTTTTSNPRTGSSNLTRPQTRWLDIFKMTT